MSKPEDLPATMSHAVGIPQTAAWHDDLNRPHQIYYGTPMTELM